MPIKTYRPITPARRYYTSNRPEVTKVKPEKSLTVALRKTGGRNNQGRLTMRHIGGGNKRRYRIVDFYREKNQYFGKGCGHRI